MSLLSWITGYDEENAKRGDAAGAAVQRINEDKIASGYYTPAQAAVINEDFATQFDTNPSTITDAFEDGWDSGRQNVSGFIKRTINAIVADPLRAAIGGLPWWVWAIGLGWLGFKVWKNFRR